MIHMTSFSFNSYISDPLSCVSFFWRHISLFEFFHANHQGLWHTFSFSELFEVLITNMNDNLVQSLWKLHTLCCKSIRSFACFYCKMPIFRSVGMREEATSTSISIFDFYDIKTLWIEFGSYIFTEYRHFTVETDKTAYTFATQCI